MGDWSESSRQHPDSYTGVMYRGPKSAKTSCPLCGKKVSVQGLRDHVAAKHKEKP